MTGYYTTINQLVTKIKKVHTSLSDDDLNNSEIIELQNNLDGRGDYIKKWKHPYTLIYLIRGRMLGKFRIHKYPVNITIQIIRRDKYIRF